MNSAISIEQTAPQKRYEWIDNSRVIAAFLIMYLHLPLALPDTNMLNNTVVQPFFVQTTYSGLVAMFLMLSGYLLGRNAPWGKTLERFFWLLVPYVLWDAIILAVHLLIKAPETVNIWSFLGVGAIFEQSWTFTSAGACSPQFNIPAWYMRDLLPLTLLTPIFVRFKKYLLPMLLIFALFPPDDLYMNPRVMMSPSTCFFYLVGIWLTNFKVEEAYRLFNDKTTIFYVLALVAAVVASINQTIFHGKTVQITLLGMLIGAMMIAHCGVMIEKHCPKLSAKLALLGPATFLVFMIHVPIFSAVRLAFPALPTSYWVLLLPIPVYAIIVSVFHTMKRYTPWLMPYLGHMKIKKKPTT